MVLTPEQHLRIATVYETAAGDRLGVTRPQRAAFARKANWFRMLARIKSKKDAGKAALEKQSQEVPPEAPSVENGQFNGGWSLPKAQRQTIAERLEKARAAAGA